MKSKRYIASVMVFAILLSLISSIGVFAADVRMSINWFDQSFEEVVVVSLDVKVTENNRYGLEFSAPSNEAAPQDINQKQTGGMLAIANQEIYFKPNGGWIQNGQELADGNVSAAFDINAWHNIKLKHTRKTGKIEVYIDDIYMGEYNLATAPEFPLNCVTVIADSSITSGIELKIVSVIGAKEGAMSAEITEHNSKDKTITVNMSEVPKNTNFAKNVEMKTTNITKGENSIPLTVKSVEGGKAVFGYTAELDKATEYAIIFPEGIEGKLGGKLENRFYYFTTNADVTKEELIRSDYNDGKASVWLENVVDGADLVVDTGDNHGKAYNFVDYNGKDFQNIWKGLTIPNEKNYSVSFDIKPMQASLKMGIEIRPTSGNPATIAYGSTGYVLAMNGYTNDGWLNLNLEKPADAWGKNNLIANYNTSEWVNYRAEFNGNKLTLYVNGVEKYSNANFGTLDKIAFRTPSSSLHAKGTQLMLLDNVVVEKVYQPPTVKQARFYDTDGKEVGPFDTSGRLIEKIQLSFSGTMDKSTFNRNTIALTFDDNRVEYEGSFNEATQIYTIKPSKLAPGGGTICVAVAEAQDTNKENISEYKTSVYAEEGENSLVIGKNQIVDADGNAAEMSDDRVYARTLIANMSNDDKNVIVSLMGYKNSALVQYGYSKIPVGANTMYKTDVDLNAISIDAKATDKIMLTVQDSDTGCPLTEAVSLKKEDTADNGSIVVTADNGFVSEGDSVTAEVYAPEKTFDDIATASDFRDVLIYKTQLSGNADGSVSQAFNISYDDAVSGMYTVKLMSKNGTKESKLFYVNSLKTAKVFNNDLKPAIDSKNVDDVAQVIRDNKYDLGVDDRYINEQIAKSAAELLIDYAKGNTLTADKITIAVNKAVGIAAFNASELTDIIADGDMFNLSGSKLKDLYNRDFVTETVRADITQRMKGGNYTTVDDFYNSLYDAFILAVVDNPEKPNCIKTVLGAFDIDASDDDCINISGKDYTTVAALKKDLTGTASPAPSKPAKPSGSGFGGGGGGGRVSVSNNTPAVSPDDSAENDSSDNTVFYDLNSVEWAREAILSLAKSGVINGKEKGKFCPMDFVTREEFIKMVSIAFGMGKSNSGVPFDDVVSGEWYADYVARAYELGIVKGYSETSFGIGQNITREDMAVILCRGAEYAGIELTESNTHISFNDDADISKYAANSVYAMKNSGAINGKVNNMFEPKAFATRAEAAKMIYGLTNNKQGNLYAFNNGEETVYEV